MRGNPVNQFLKHAVNCVARNTANLERWRDRISVWPDGLPDYRVPQQLDWWERITKAAAQQRERIARIRQRRVPRSTTPAVRLACRNGRAL